jgi:hypothetical protein
MPQGGAIGTGGGLWHKPTASELPGRGLLSEVKPTSVLASSAASGRFQVWLISDSIAFADVGTTPAWAKRASVVRDTNSLGSPDHPLPRRPCASINPCVYGDDRAGQRHVGLWQQLAQALLRERHVGGARAGRGIALGGDGAHPERARQRRQRLERAHRNLADALTVSARSWGSGLV